MQPIKSKISVHENVTYVKPFRILDDHQQSIDLTGYTALMTIKTAIEDEEPVLLITDVVDDDGNQIIIEPEIGMVKIKIARTSLDYNGVYDLYLFDADDNSELFIQPSSITIKTAVSDFGVG